MLQKVLQLIKSVLANFTRSGATPAPAAPLIHSSTTISVPKKMLRPEDEKKLSELYPPFAEVVRQFLIEANQQGMVVGVFEGLRTFQRQQELFNQGRNSGGSVVDRSRVVTNAPPGLSAHNYGCAVDLVFNAALPGQPWHWSWDSKHPWKKLAELSVKHGLDAAYFWRIFPEMPHSELIYGCRFHEMLALYHTGELPAVWSKLDEIRNKV